MEVKSTKNNAEQRILKTGIVIIAFCLIWMILELILYGEVQSRVVDDIIMSMFIPFIYRAMR